jgi:membrane-anchored glycerophosphoryl diester phosphodiesterase (GDPDase)
VSTFIIIIIIIIIITIAISAAMCLALLFSNPSQALVTAIALFVVLLQTHGCLLVWMQSCFLPL